MIDSIGSRVVKDGNYRQSTAKVATIQSRNDLRHLLLPGFDCGLGMGWLRSSESDHASAATPL